MNARRIFVQACQVLLLVGALQLGSTGSPVPGLATAAQAVVGAPLSPVSYAGVARRTARRTAVVVSSSSSAAAASASASASASQQQAAAAQQQAAAAQQQAAQAEAEAAAARQEAAAAKDAAAAAQQAAKLPVGTTVSALPNGCTTINLGGVDYFNCAGTYYRAAFQSNNIVYVVSQP
jgi:hypothetical protein